MKNSEEIRMIKELYDFLYGEENMAALEELTASLKNALTVYEENGRRKRKPTVSSLAG